MLARLSLRVAEGEPGVQIENLAEDIDFRAIVTRDQLDAVCADLSGRLSQPINEALAMANLTVVRLPLFLCNLLADAGSGRHHLGRARRRPLSRSSRAECRQVDRARVSFHHHAR